MLEIIHDIHAITTKSILIGTGLDYMFYYFRKRFHAPKKKDGVKPCPIKRNME